MMKHAVSVVACVAMLTSGCASASRGRVAPAPPPSVIDPTVMADYVQRIPPGSRVRVERTSGDTMRGTLMNATAEHVTVQRSTRVPEPPIDVPLRSIARITLDNGGGSSTAKAIAIGVASGVGTFFGILAILASALD